MNLSSIKYLMCAIKVPPTPPPLIYAVICIYMKYEFMNLVESYASCYDSLIYGSVSPFQV